MYSYGVKTADMLIDIMAEVDFRNTLCSNYEITHYRNFRFAGMRDGNCPP